MKRFQAWLLTVIAAGLLGVGPDAARAASHEGTAYPFAIDGPDSVSIHSFTVLTPGEIRAEVTWNEGDDGSEIQQTASYGSTLTARLIGPSRGTSRSRAIYARQSSGSPLVLTYEVTPADVARGVGWRLVLRDPQGGQARGTVSLTVPGDPEAERGFQREKIRMIGGVLRPSEARTADFVKRLRGSGAERLHGIISLARTPTAEESQQLEKLGVVRQSFLPGGHAYGYVRRGLDLEDPLVSELVEYLTLPDPAAKIDPDVLEGNYRRFLVTPEDGEPQNYVLNADGTLQISVIFAGGVSPQRAQRLLRGAGARKITHASDEQWHVTLAPSQLLPLAASDVVQSIGPGPEPFLPENDTTRATVNVDPVQAPATDAMGNLVLVGGFPNYLGFSGAGIVVGVDDSGIDANHNDLDVVDDRPAAGSHGTHVAGIVAASGFQSDKNDDSASPNGGNPFQWRGMAPEAGLIDSGNLIDASNLFGAIFGSSMDAGNHSHALGPDGNYNSDNRAIDRAIRGGAFFFFTNIPRRPKAFSAGNGGASAQYGNQRAHFATTKQVKNALVVGNWDANNNDLSTGSSMGPTYDGRIKPDVVAPGSSITSTGTGGTANGYRSSGGTSMASPVVAGTLALMLEAWATTYSQPQGTTIDADPPLPSTLRAVIAHTAADIVDPDVRSSTSAEIDSDSNPGNGNDGLGRATATAGPDFSTGWGLLDAEAAVELIREKRISGGVPVPARIIEDAVGQGDVDEYSISVTQVGPLKVTLAWDDFESATQSPAVSSLLVNDLDLELVDPSGTVFYPWQLGQTILDGVGNPLPDNAQPPGTVIQVQLPINPTLTPALNDDYIPANALSGNGAWVARRGKDHLNNIEQVLVPDVTVQQLGSWTVRVLGFNVQTASQDYSLVGFPFPPPLPNIQIPGGVDAGEACVGGQATATLEVCNTGTAHLFVGAIASSDPQFSVTVPSGGFPVDISPDFCFPLEVVFSPTSAGAQSATLTVPSNDPDQPSVNVAVSGTGTEPDIRVTGSTDFGVTSAWSPAERTVSVCNTGGCQLSVTGAATSCADFTLVNNPFPDDLAPGSCLDAVVRFTPVLPGSKSCDLSITSDDPDTPVVTLPLTATTPPAISFHAGLVVPHGPLGNVARQGSTFTLGYVHPFQPKLAWDVRLGHASFDGRPGFDDTNVWSVTSNIRFVFNPGAPVRVLLTGGLGVYHLDPGDFEAGIDGGVGLQIPAGKRFAFEAVYRHNLVFTATPDVEYGQGELGFLVSF